MNRSMIGILFLNFCAQAMESNLITFENEEPHVSSEQKERLHNTGKDAATTHSETHRGRWRETVPNHFNGPHKQLFAAILESDFKKTQGFLLNNDYKVDDETLQKAQHLATQLLENKTEATPQCFSWNQCGNLTTAITFGTLAIFNWPRSEDADVSPYILPFVGFVGCCIYMIKGWRNHHAHHMRDQALLVNKTVWQRILLWPRPSEPSITIELEKE